MKGSAIVAIFVTLGIGYADQQPQFKATVSVVRLEVSVTDERGAVRGLQRDDFVVTDSGVPRSSEFKSPPTRRSTSC